MRGMNRRNFLSLLGGVGLAAFGGLPSLLKLAEAADAPEAPAQYFIFCYFGGGWDILLSLDPRDPAVFTNEAISETLIQPGYEELDPATTDGQLITTPEGIVFGPYIGELAKHASKLSVVRGMSMETLSHEAGRRRFLTARVPSGINPRGSSIVTWLASILGEGQALPNLSAKVEVFNLDQPPYASGIRIDSVNDLLRALRPGTVTLSDKEERQIDALLADFASCDSSRQSGFYVAAEGARQNANDLVKRRIDALFDFQAQTADMEALRAHYGIPTGSSAMSGAEAQAAMAVTALTQGLSRCVSIEIAGGLDTHGSEWSNSQGPRQQKGFNLIARMMEDLEGREYRSTGTSWLDHPTIVAFSEFSRTALLNANGGRDHALTNACFLLGAGIRGATVVGRSSDVGLAPTATNLMSGQEDANGEVIHPEHVMRTLFEIAGITDDVADLRVEPVWALMS